jgi:Protein of unknown function (DUF3047)
MRGIRVALVMVAGLMAVPLSARAVSANEVPLDVHEWKIIERESGDVNYYKVIDIPDMPYIHSAYEPGMDTAVMGHGIPGGVKNPQKLRWTWRAMTLPKGGNECESGKGDSAASVYVLWKRGLKYYALKYVWSTTGERGAVCGKKRSPFLAQDIVIAESGYPVGVWKTEEIDLAAEFRKHFADGDASAAVPDLKGVGIMSDGDQTHSPSSADFGGFVVVAPGGGGGGGKSGK